MHVINNNYQKKIPKIRIVMYSITLQLKIQNCVAQYQLQDFSDIIRHFVSSLHVEQGNVLSFSSTNTKQRQTHFLLQVPNLFTDGQYATNLTLWNLYVLHVYVSSFSLYKSSILRKMSQELGKNTKNTISIGVSQFFLTRLIILILG